MPLPPGKLLSLGVITNSVTRRAGGMFISMREPRIELVKRNVAVHAYGVMDDFFPEDGPLWAPVELSVYHAFGPKRFGFAPALARAIEAADHDVLHQHGLWMYPSLIASAWRKRTGKPTVISPHGMLDPWALRHSAWKKWLAKLLFEDKNLAGASCFHALNKEEAESIRALGFSAPIATVPNGVRLPDLTRPAPAPAWSANDPRQALLFLGRIHQKKGIDQLIEAWALLKQSNPRFAASWVLVIAGWDDGGHEASLRRLVHRKKLDSDVRFIGPVHGAEKEGTLRHAGAFVLPSFSEGLPVAVLEAWSYELPVFMTDACNLPRGFEVGAAFRVTSDPADIAARLAEHLDDAEGLRIAGQRGRSLVTDEYSWESIADEFVSIYRWLTAGGEPPRSVA